jgi:hypothetical protein
MKAIGAILLAGILGGCTSVRMVQRDGCWLRVTERWPSRVTEEMGPCTAPTTEWADDRITRVVQECIARADQRWQTRALVAWDRGDPIPERDADGKVMQECMSEPTRALAGENAQLRERNGVLEARLAELGSERDALRSRADEAGVKLLGAHEKLADKLLTGQERMAEYLGEAAKKSSQPAVATATATSASDGVTSADVASQPVPAAITPTTAAAPPASAQPPAIPAAPRRAASTQVVRATPARAKAPDRCDPAAPSVQRRARSPKGASGVDRGEPCPPPASAAPVRPDAEEKQGR